MAFENLVRIIPPLIHRSLTRFATLTKRPLTNPFSACGYTWQALVSTKLLCQCQTLTQRRFSVTTRLPPLRGVALRCAALISQFIKHATLGTKQKQRQSNNTISCGCGASNPRRGAVRADTRGTSGSASVTRSAPTGSSVHDAPMTPAVGHPRYCDGT